MKLFRQEVLDKRLQSLEGTVLVIPRLRDSIVCGIILVWLLAVFLWLGLSSYSTKVTVQGWIEPEDGVSRVFAQGGTYVQEILVRDGDSVEVGQPLAYVGSQAVGLDGKLPKSKAIYEGNYQIELIDKAIDQTFDAFAQKNQLLADQITLLNENIADSADLLVSIDNIVDVAKQRSDAASDDPGPVLATATEMAPAVFEEIALLALRKSAIADRKLQMEQRQQLEFDQHALSSQLDAALRPLRIQRSALDQQITQQESIQRHALIAPISGTISNLQVTAGEWIAEVGARVPLMTIIPPRRKMIVRLLIPVRASAFVKPGQHIHMRFDAFPFTEFGLHEGDVQFVSDDALLPGELQSSPVTAREPIYKATASIRKDTVRVVDREVPLIPGMTLSADIELQSQSMLNWLARPVSNLRGQL